MKLAGRHREDIKAELRKQFGSMSKFEKLKGLPLSSVSDVLRGKPSARVTAAVNDALSHLPAPKSGNRTKQSDIPVDTSDDAKAHRLNAGVK